MQLQPMGMESRLYPDVGEAVFERSSPSEGQYTPLRSPGEERFAVVQLFFHHVILHCAYQLHAPCNLLMVVFDLEAWTNLSP